MPIQFFRMSYITMEIMFYGNNPSDEIYIDTYAYNFWFDELFRRQPNEKIIARPDFRLMGNDHQ